MEPIYQYNENARFKGLWESKIVKAGSGEVFSEIQGPGIIQHLWLTTFPINQKEDYALASQLTLNIYWDHAKTAAISTPITDFFCQPLKLQLISNHFFRSTNNQLLFTTTIPMPFYESAKFELINHSDREIELFYGIDVEFMPPGKDSLYLHTHQQTSEHLDPEQPHTILPKTTGKGRYLGTHMALKQNQVLENWPWYTRPISVFLDANTSEQAPSLYIKTIDDFFGSGWWDREEEHNAYTFPFVGRSLVEMDDQHTLSIALYRYHVQEPLWFHQSVSIELGKNWNWGNQSIGNGSWSTTAFYYLNKPEHDLN